MKKIKIVSYSVLLLFTALAIPFSKYQDKKKDELANSFIRDYYNEILVTNQDQSIKIENEEEIIVLNRVLKDLYQKDTKSAGYNSIQLDLDVVGMYNNFQLSIYKNLGGQTYYIRIATIFNPIGVMYIANDPDKEIDEIYIRHFGVQ